MKSTYVYLNEKEKVKLRKKFPYKFIFNIEQDLV